MKNYSFNHTIWKKKLACLRKFSRWKVDICIFLINRIYHKDSCGTTELALVNSKWYNLRLCTNREKFVVHCLTAIFTHTKPNLCFIIICTLCILNTCVIYLCSRFYFYKRQGVCKYKRSLISLKHKNNRKFVFA